MTTKQEATRMSTARLIDMLTQTEANTRDWLIAMQELRTRDVTYEDARKVVEHLKKEQQKEENHFDKTQE
ncbi:hypothetical protein [Schaalia sp. ZJ1691]|uniref:hypothetical protein n=1 Tax=Schaalia sp. ZJ1691 TaxID=2709404 RepID=UPI0013EA371A|nr:hypothetical protein [Schaalia sp. ZJ1691]